MKNSFLKVITATLILHAACTNNHDTAGNKSAVENKEIAENIKTDSLDSMVRPDLNEIKLAASSEKKEFSPAAQTISVKIHSMEGYGQDTVFARSAAALLEKIINSQDFRDAVVGNTYKHDENLTPTQIYERIMNAHESDGPGGQDKVIDLRLRTINATDDGSVWLRRCEPGSAAGTIGIDGGGTGIAAVCPQWLRSTAEAGKTEWLAAHFMHEYMHILGFRHPNKKPKSVPYKIHGIIEALGEDLK